MPNVFVKAVSQVKLSGSTAPKLLTGTADPSAGAGVVAPVGSLYIRTGTVQLWQKTGAGDTQWTKNGTADPA
jgi:hypothetical protein